MKMTLNKIMFTGVFILMAAAICIVYWYFTFADGMRHWGGLGGGLWIVGIIVVGLVQACIEVWKADKK